MGRNWVSEKGKNLTFSILNKFENFPAAQQFRLNMITSLALVDVLKRHKIPDLKVKWPNDILSGGHKICGLLLEVLVKGSNLRAAIIGIGLNVNQEHFGEELRATSMKICSGRTYDLDPLLEEICTAVTAAREKYLAAPHTGLWPAYEELLFGKGDLLRFRTPEDEVFSAVIQGVDATGRLKLKHLSGKERTYFLNEIKMEY